LWISLLMSKTDTTSDASNNRIVFCFKARMARTGMLIDRQLKQSRLGRSRSTNIIRACCEISARMLKTCNFVNIYNHYFVICKQLTCKYYRLHEQTQDLCKVSVC
jgi:hypothetical protein